MAIEEFALDLNDPDEFQACRNGDSIYVRRPTYYDDDDWHEVYTVTQAATQFDIGFLYFKWVEINSATGKEGTLYIQASRAYNHQAGQLYCLKSSDYGATWSGAEIQGGIIRASGGIWAGRVTGDVMYATYCSGLTSAARVRYSTDEGSSWSNKDVLDVSVWVGRVMIDPSTEATSYTGKDINGPNLAKATTNSGSYSNIKDDAGIALYYGYGGGWISADDGDYIRTIKSNVLYFSDDEGSTWDENNVSDVGHGAVFERAMWGHDSTPQWVGVASRTDISSPFVNYHLLKSTEDNGGTWYDKAGANASTIDTGDGDSIPYNCGGTAENGLYLMIPGGRVYTSVVAMRALPTGGTVYADGVQMGTLPTGGTVYASGVEQESPRPT